MAEKQSDLLKVAFCGAANMCAAYNLDRNQTAAVINIMDRNAGTALLKSANVRVAILNKLAQMRGY
ncbi:MAG: hypothetical protein RR382_00085 [Tannerellaceae bacterium]